MEDRCDLPFQLHGHARLRDPIGYGRHAKDPRAATMSLLDLHRTHRRRGKYDPRSSDSSLSFNLRSWRSSIVGAVFGVSRDIGTATRDPSEC